ncbi:hypothetical protein LTR56_000880 [Elasticomyces elasticus]|nr:hypothetical protein LTR56_000880 [Elasticomyces elasticus]KAK3665454.1 hypothetical protein LTR22_003684 [Elasticomyces elasticus]KAK4929903.1 hypothetical protein LTR49_003530 [Elasticomyces elasticus]KAK5769287.1 hypothetical protein LTS12_000638 [Elasticomyces elasticus]
MARRGRKVVPDTDSEYEEPRTVPETSGSDGLFIPEGRKIAKKSRQQQPARPGRAAQQTDPDDENIIVRKRKQSPSNDALEPGQKDNRQDSRRIRQKFARKSAFVPPRPLKRPAPEPVKESPPRKPTTKLDRRIVELELEVEKSGHDPKTLYRMMPPKSCIAKTVLQYADVELLRLVFVSYGRGLNWGFQVDRIARHAYNHGSEDVPLHTADPIHQAVLQKAARAVALIHRRCRLVRDDYWEHPTKSAYFGYVVSTIMLLTAYQNARPPQEGLFAWIFKTELVDPMPFFVREEWDKKFEISVRKFPVPLQFNTTDESGPVEFLAEEVEATGEGCDNSAPFTSREELAVLAIVRNMKQYLDATGPGSWICWKDVAEVLPGRTALECENAYWRNVGQDGVWDDLVASMKDTVPDSAVPAKVWSPGSPADDVEPPRYQAADALEAPNPDQTERIEEGNVRVSAPSNKHGAGTVVDAARAQGEIAEPEGLLPNANSRIAELEAALRAERATNARLVKDLSGAKETISALQNGLEVDTVGGGYGEKLAEAEAKIVNLHQQVGELENAVQEQDQVVNGLKEQLDEKNRKVGKKTKKVGASAKAPTKDEPKPRWRP